MDSEFNTFTSDSLFYEGNFIEIGRSERFRYFKTRRNGVVLFVKMPSEDYFHDLLTTEALKKEFLIGYGLNHPGIVRYYAYEEYRLYEEFIEGDSLQTLIENDDNRLHQKEFIENICCQILEALRYLHSNGIIHLDLKPQNIILSRHSHQVKIIDLSCAQSISDNSTTGFTKGYEAPEQLTGNINETTDIFQIGKIFEELTLIAKCQRKWRKFIEKATAYHSDHRFKTVEEAINSIPKTKTLFPQFLSFIIPFFIVIVFLSIWSFHKIESDSAIKKNDFIELLKNEKEEHNDIITDRGIKPTKKNIETSQSDFQKEMAIEKEIDNKINQHIDAILSKEVTPLYEKILSDKRYRKNKEISQEFNRAREKALEALIVYGEDLSEEYPERTTYIKERMLNTVEDRYSLMLLKLYPRD